MAWYNLIVAHNALGGARVNSLYVIPHNNFINKLFLRRAVLLVTTLTTNKFDLHTTHFTQSR